MKLASWPCLHNSHSSAAQQELSVIDRHAMLFKLLFDNNICITGAHTATLVADTPGKADGRELCPLARLAGAARLRSDINKTLALSTYGTHPRTRCRLIAVHRAVAVLAPARHSRHLFRHQFWLILRAHIYLIIHIDNIFIRESPE